MPQPIFMRSRLRRSDTWLQLVSSGDHKSGFAELGKQQAVQCIKVLEQLDDISTNCWKLDYLAARAGYMKLTLGIFVANKKMDRINFEQLE